MISQLGTAAVASYPLCVRFETGDKFGGVPEVVRFATLDAAFERGSTLMTTWLADESVCPTQPSHARGNLL